MTQKNSSKKYTITFYIKQEYSNPYLQKKIRELLQRNNKASGLEISSTTFTGDGKVVFKCYTNEDPAGILNIKELAMSIYAKECDVKVVKRKNKGEVEELDISLLIEMDKILNQQSKNKRRTGSNSTQDEKQIGADGEQGNILGINESQADTFLMPEEFKISKGFPQEHLNIFKQLPENAKVVKQQISRLLVRDQVCGKTFKVISEALKSVTCRNHEKQIIKFLKNLFSCINSASETGEEAVRVLSKIADTDPAIFFDFCQKSKVDLQGIRGKLPEVLEIMNERVPGRELQCIEVCMHVFRSLIGDTKTRTPLLCGPPGTGKSLLMREFAAAMTEAAGINVETAFIQLASTMGNANQDNVSNNLYGISSHYSNGRPGLIYDKASCIDTDLVIVTLDEIDKFHCHDFFVGLLDPENPLQDSFANEIFSNMDLRKKVVFMATANDEGAVMQGALGSRLCSLRFPEYTEEEKRDLLVHLILRDETLLSYGATEEFVEKCVAELDLSDMHDGLRTAIDHVGKKLFAKAVEIDNVLEEQLHGQCKESECSRKQIGFMR